MPLDPSLKHLLSDLSDRQRDAVTHGEGPLLIVAGPGSGKTRVMAHRVAYLISELGLAPWKILAVTFTNKAARELRERCERLIGVGSNELQVRTFHSFCSRVLRVEGELVGLKPEFTIYDTDDQTRIIRRVLDDLDIDQKQFSPRSLLSVISEAKNAMRYPAELKTTVETYRDEIAARVYESYEAALHRANSVDFDDLLLKTFVLFEGNPEITEKYQKLYEHMLVDEFQDTNTLQFQVAKLLSIKNKNICVVGDPDQSIYSWRHADPSNLTDFQRTFPDAKIITLDQSYRSTEIILEAADAVIDNNNGRIEKKLWTDNGRGKRVTVAEAYNEEEEARLVIECAKDLKQHDGITQNKIAVMYRVNAQSRAFEVACNREGIPYRLVGGVKFYDRKEVKDILSFLRLISNPSDDAALERIINTPARGLSVRTVGELRKVSGENSVSLLDVILDVTRAQSENNETSVYCLNLGSRALNSIGLFGDMIAMFIEQSLLLDTNDLIDLIAERTGYAAMLREDKERGEERMENLQELKASADQFAGSEERGQLSEFLENVALVSDVDDLQGGDNAGTDNEGITLITLHQAKGLEYDAVFLVGLEEGLLPHSRSVDDPMQLEEERRLLYVGMTRARKRLFMFRAFQRRFRGQSGSQMASRFLQEIPTSHVITRNIRGHARLLDRAHDPMWTKRMASTRSSRSASRERSPVFNAGEKVLHKSLGEGVVVSSSGEGEQTQVTVAFSGHGIKRLLLSFAPLEKIRQEPKENQFDPDEIEPEFQDPDLFAP
ncbi:MAG: hypothetical protein CL791_05710 [Chloroflexi bacterium]|nr:hypothetical protein [Chloroflexota bacterium]